MYIGTKKNGNQKFVVMEHGYPTDRVFSFHRTMAAADKVVAKYNRAAKRQLGSTGYTTLFSTETARTAVNQ
jgi:hypothetical protein